MGSDPRPGKARRAASAAGSDPGPSRARRAAGSDPKPGRKPRAAGAGGSDPEGAAEAGLAYGRADQAASAERTDKARKKRATPAEPPKEAKRRAAKAPRPGRAAGAATADVASGAEALAGKEEGIGVYAESGLHAGLKLALAGPEDRFEVAVDGKVVDLVRRTPRGEELVEIQTKRLDKIQSKVLGLASGHRVRVVHPVVAELSIARLSPETGELLSERKSPKRGDFLDLFDELVRATGLIGARNVTVEVLLVSCREIRCRDGTGSWRRRGDRVLSRDLGEIRGSRSFSKLSDWLALLPEDLAPPWTSASLGEALGIGADRARKILYSYTAAGLVSEAGREGRRKLYIPVSPAKRGGRRRPA